MNYLIRQRELYWRPHSSGYTSHLGLAGVYKEEEAMNLVKYNREPPDIAIPLDINIREDIEQEMSEAQSIIHGCQVKLDLLDNEND